MKKSLVFFAMMFLVGCIGCSNGYVCKNKKDVPLMDNYTVNSKYGICVTPCSANSSVEEINVTKFPWLGFNMKCVEKGKSLKVTFKGRMYDGPISIHIKRKNDGVPETMMKRTEEIDKSEIDASSFVRVFPWSYLIDKQAIDSNGVEIIILSHGKSTYFNGQIEFRWVDLGN